MSSSLFSARGRSRVIVRAHDLESSLLETRAIQRSARSQKYLFGLRDGYAIETVVIKRADGFTACVSSQVGCAFGCSFCASGRAGLIRNLSSIEIVEQVVRLEQRVNRIVFMGIGEPLNNYDNVLRAIRILRDRDGLAIPTTGITLSTIGIPKALVRLREEHLAINLTVSLHATTQRVRAGLIPGAAKHRLENVVGAALSWAQRHGRPVTFAYVLLPGLNDSADDARRLGRMLVGRPARVNLLRWNPVEGAYLQRTRERSLAIFRRELARAGIPAIVRDTQGADIDAACGQLWLRDLNGSHVARRSAPRVHSRGSRRGDRPARLRRPRRRG
jgi:23S rRNA (adenine2503-C2)-methyltransferase